MPERLITLPAPLPHQLEILSSSARHKLVVAGRKFGKALDVETPIPTPEGWRTMGDLRTGDVVFDDSGAQTEVVFVSDVMRDRKCFEVRFTDGSSIVADGDHQWLSYTKAARKSASRSTRPIQPSVLTTDEIRVTLRYRSEANHAVKLCGPIQCNALALPIHPYVLGVWLGDGSKNDGSIASNDPLIPERIRMLGHDVVKSKARYMWAIRDLRWRLRSLEVLNNKHVPEAYLRASVEQRRELLAGLMDTDGTASKKGHCSFDNMDKGLADAVFELLVSLGEKPIMHERQASLYGKPTGTCYRVQFAPQQQVFWLPRKAARLRAASRRQSFRCIESVTEVESRPVRCIQVASTSCLYLAGRSFIPTHNTKMCLIPVVDGHGPGGFFRGAARGARGLWTAPTYGIASDIWRDLKSATHGAWLDKSEQEKRIEFPGGGAISVRSADDPDSLRGPNYDFVVIDEAAMVKEETWTEVLRPTLAATRGWSIFISTPKGQNWFYDLFIRCEKQPGWQRWQRPTSDNPKVTPDELEAIKRDVSSYVFAQEHLAEFLSPGIGLFKRAMLKRYRFEGDEIVFEDNTAARFNDLRRFVTVDTATSTKTSADMTSIAAWGIEPYDRLALLDLDLRRIEGPEIMRSIVAMCDKWKCTARIEENSTSKHLLSFMEAEGIDFLTLSPGSQDKWTRAQEAAAMWEHGKIVFPESTAGLERDFLVAAERQAFGFTPQSKGNDDFVDCMAYAARVAREETTPRIGFQPIEGSKPHEYVLRGSTITRQPPGIFG